MDNATKIQLDSFIGATVHYEKQNIKIEKYKEVAGNICVVTNVRTFQFYPEEIQSKFLDKISDAKEEGSFIPPTEIEKKSFVALPEENITVKNTILEMLDKIKKDPSIIQKAKAIFIGVNTLVNVQKTEIEMIKLQKDL